MHATIDELLAIRLVPCTLEKGVVLMVRDYDETLEVLALRRIRVTFLKDLSVCFGEGLYFVVVNEVLFVSNLIWEGQAFFVIKDQCRRIIFINQGMLEDEQMFVVDRYLVTPGQRFLISVNHEGQITSCKYVGIRDYK